MATQKPPSGRRWKKGQSGNPKGRKKGVPNKATKEAKEFFESITDDATYRQNLYKRACAGRLPAPVECLIWYYAKGKPKERIEHSGTIQSGDLQTLSDEQLERIRGVMKEGEDGG